MSRKESSIRLWIYCAIAFFTPVAPNWNAMEHATFFQWGGLMLQGIVTSLVAARAYIDQTPSRLKEV